MKLYVVIKMQGERKRGSDSLFSQLSSQPYLMAGHRFTQIITNPSNMKSHRGVWGAKERRRKTGRKTETAINHLCCHLNLSLHLRAASKLLIWNNKQKR